MEAYRRLADSAATLEVEVLDLIEVRIPDAPGAPGWADFVSGINIRRRVEAHAYDCDDFGWEPEEELPHYQDAAAPQRMLLARDHRGFVGRARYETELSGDTAWVNVEVPPEFRGEGIGTALAAAVEAKVHSLGFRKAIAYVPIREEEGPRLAAPTGAGSVPANSRDVRFLQRRGYVLEQVERASRLALPMVAAAERLEAARARIAPDYALQTWIGATPKRWLVQMAELLTRMSTDAPTAGLAEPERLWTAEVVQADEKRLADDPSAKFTAVAVHLSTDALAGFTSMSVPPRLDRPVVQWSTLVRREHRGSGLGLAIKLANIGALQQAAPGHPSITTSNAEENLHMLAVNEALGFVPLAAQSGWRKEL